MCSNVYDLCMLNDLDVIKSIVAPSILRVMMDASELSLFNPYFKPKWQGFPHTKWRGVKTTNLVP